MKHTMFWLMLVAGLCIACGDDEETESSTMSSGSGNAGGTAGSGGATSVGACTAECATSGCADSSPDQACGDCAEANCGSEIAACVGDAGMCGSGDCSSCGALLTCDECSDQLQLDPEGQALFDAILTCMCGE